MTWPIISFVWVLKRMLHLPFAPIMMLGNLKFGLRAARAEMECVQAYLGAGR